MPSISRRNILAFGAAAGALGLVGKIPFARAESARPHFLLSIQIAGAWDTTYVFDGRGPKLTEKNRHQNYLLENDMSPASTRPAEFTEEKIAARTIRCERTGSAALRFPLMDALWDAHKDCMSVVNGVYMLRDSVGHGENSAYLWGNTARGGMPIFPPMVGKRLATSPLDSVVLRESSTIFPAPSNLTGSVELASRDVSALSQTLATGPQIDESSEAWRYILERSDLSAASDGQFGNGSKNLSHALRKAKATGTAFAAASGGMGTAPGAATLSGSVKRALSFFNANMTRVAAIMQSMDVDLHSSSTSQRNLITNYTRIADELKACIDLLKQTMFVDASGRATPFIELTTFLVSSEMGRTARSQSFSMTSGSVGATGSDHNPFSNTVLVGGRGIANGLVVGESDLQACDDDGNYLDVSGAHQQKNPRLDSPMGKPFDFETQRVRTDLPASFDEFDYICMPSVTNTLLDTFEVPESSRYRIGSRVAPILSVLRERGT